MTDPYVNNLPKGATWSEGPALDTETRGNLDSMEIVHVTAPSLKDASKAFKLPSVEQMKREVETGEFSPESIAIANSILESAENIEDAVDNQDRWWEDGADFEPIYKKSEAELANETLMRNYSDLTDHERDLLKSRQAQRRARSQAWREEAEAMVVDPKFTPAEDYHKKQEALYRQALEAGELIGTQQYTEKQTREALGRVTESITPATAHFKQIATEAKKTKKAFKKISKAISQKPAPGAKLQHRPFLILSAIRDEL